MCGLGLREPSALEGDFAPTLSGEGASGRGPQYDQPVPRGDADAKKWHVCSPSVSLAQLPRGWHRQSRLKWWLMSMERCLGPYSLLLEVPITQALSRARSLEPARMNT
jgi:hypothetical protein